MRTNFLRSAISFGGGVVRSGLGRDMGLIRGHAPASTPSKYDSRGRILTQGGTTTWKHVLHQKFAIQSPLLNWIRTQNQTPITTRSITAGNIENSL